MLQESLNSTSVPAAPALTSERAFSDLETILYSIASSPSHYRNFAVHYMRCRTVLLNGPGRSAVPGFLIQCGTSEKFREFITLYDASPKPRHLFLDQALSGCRAAFGVARASVDAFFDDEDF